MIRKRFLIRCFNNINLFEITKADDIVNNWICLLQEKYNCTVLKHTLYPDRLELVIIIKKDAPVKRIIANGKRFMAYEIVFRLYDHHKYDIIIQLKNGLRISEIKKGQLHKVFISNKSKWSWKLRTYN
jgi:hypothetical protein